MSNAAIVARIELLLCQLEAGEICCKDFGQQFEAHFPALENLGYPQIQAAGSASSDMEVVDEFGNENLFELDSVSDVVSWVRNWLREVPR